MMQQMDTTLRRDEAAALALRRLYRSFGYRQYRVSKFEEYELYARNRNFLLSDRILTFTDTDGRLMAMKPDVTLSIVKSYNNEPLCKLFYDETVYRPGDGGFAQIQQTGLECIGQVDDFLQCEVLTLACRSLAGIDAHYLLDVSHMGFVSALVAEAAPQAQEELLRLIGQKNVPGIRALCTREGVEAAYARALEETATLYAPAKAALSQLRRMVRNERMAQACDELGRTLEGVLRFDPQAKLMVDLSLVNDMHYYNGVIFRGFLDGVPSAVLSGGRYDNLLRRMGHDNGRAIGFALYVNLLEQLEREPARYDVDVLLRYAKQDDMQDVIAAANALRAQGYSICAQAEDAPVRAQRTACVEKGGYRFVDEND